MQANPALRGQVLDLPHAVEGARHEAKKRGMSERFTAVVGDFFATVPEADLYLLKMILHDWDDERCVQILRNCRAAVHPRGRALIVERVIGGLGQPDFATLADMNMLSIIRAGWNVISMSLTHCSPRPDGAVPTPVRLVVAIPCLRWNPPEAWHQLLLPIRGVCYARKVHHRSRSAALLVRRLVPAREANASALAAASAGDGSRLAPKSHGPWPIGHTMASTVEISPSTLRRYKRRKYFQFRRLGGGGGGGIVASQTLYPLRDALNCAETGESRRMSRRRVVAPPRGAPRFPRHI